MADTKLPELPKELYEHYPEMSAQTHEAHVKQYARAALASEQAASQPVYFYRTRSSTWIETTAEDIAALKAQIDLKFEFRTLYTRPASVPAIAGEPDDVEKRFDDPFMDACDRLLNYAINFFETGRKHGQAGAVRWIDGDNGELVIFTRGEYRDTIMQNIHRIDQPVHYFAAPNDGKDGK